MLGCPTLGSEGGGCFAVGKEAGGEVGMLRRWLRGAVRARNPRLMVGFMLFWPQKCQSVTDNVAPGRVTRAD